MFNDPKQFLLAINQITEEKGIAQEKIIEAIQMAIAAAYKREYGEKSQIIKAELNLDDDDPNQEDLKIFQIKQVVEGIDEEGFLTSELPSKQDGGKTAPAAVFVESTKAREEGSGETAVEELRTRYNPERHLVLEEARRINPAVQIGEEVIFPLETKTDFGRIAAQTAKQVIIQKLREVEREVILAEFKSKEGEIISGAVQRREGPMVYVDLGRTNGLLLPPEQLPNDHYRIGQRFRFLVVRVEETNKGPVVIISRTHPKLVSKLFEVEVPEIESGSVEIKTLAREPGSRSKIAVISHEEGVDPIGSLVGQKGVRVQTVINELSGEKIDIIQWTENPEKFIANALSPAKILNVKILNENRRHALVEVNDDQFSLAIGRQGQNVRLAAKLTGWKIDVRSPKEVLTLEEAEDEGKTTEGADPLTQTPTEETEKTPPEEIAEASSVSDQSVENPGEQAEIKAAEIQTAEKEAETKEAV